MKQVNISKICKAIEEYGLFNGDVMGEDTYVIFKHSFAQALAHVLEE